MAVSRLAWSEVPCNGSRSTRLPQEGLAKKFSNSKQVVDRSLMHLIVLSSWNKLHLHPPETIRWKPEVVTSKSHRISNHYVLTARAFPRSLTAKASETMKRHPLKGRRLEHRDPSSPNVNGWWLGCPSSPPKRKAGWWFQPIWKICSSHWIISPKIGVKIKNVWNHHLVCETFLNSEVI